MNIGIDLGTHYVRVAYLGSDGGPRLLADPTHNGAMETPALIYLGRDSVLVGFRAQELTAYDHSLPVIRRIKHSLGTRQQFKDGAGRPWSPSEAAAMLFRKINEDVQRLLHKSVQRAVITVPHSFDAGRRQALVVAAKAAGLQQVELLDESLAVALRTPTRPARSLVINMGASSFDASIVELVGNDLSCVLNLVTPQIGGDAFDDILVAEIDRLFIMQHRVEAFKDPIERFVWQQRAEAIKIRMSDPGMLAMREVLFSGSRLMEVAFSNFRFQALLLPALEKAAKLCGRLLERAKLRWDEIELVVFSGGSTLLPQFREVFRTITGVPSEKILQRQPKEACCFGAAQFAATQGADGRSVRRTLNYSVHLATRSGGLAMNEQIFGRQTSLPANRTVVIRCSQLRQPVVEFTLQHKSSTGEAIGEALVYKFTGINNDKNSQYPIEVVIAADLDGVLTATARDPMSGRGLAGGGAFGLDRPSALVSSVKLQK